VIVKRWPESNAQYGVAEVREIRIDNEADIVEVRRYVRDLAKECRFDQFAVAALTTAASELSRNVWVHAQRGIARIDVLRSGTRIGVELEMIDEGPGIADLSKALAGGYSTANSLGLGLSGTKRLVDEFNVDTELGKGTRILIRKWKKEF
jgi:serine/threonine-protein kinase RsbT